MTVVFGDIRDQEKFQLTLSEDVKVVESVQSLTTYLEEHEDEDLLVVDADVPMVVAMELAEKYRLERPSLGVILVRNRIEVQTLTEALRSGVREVVARDDAEALLNACRRSQSVSRQMRLGTHRGADGQGKVIMVFSAKGGCGKTTLATNLAEALASSGAGRVCLVDYNLDFGDVAIAMQVDPIRTVSDALGMQGGLDRHGVESMVISARPKLDVLLAPTQPADAEFITAELAAEVLGLLREVYDYVVIDSAPSFNDVVLKCFDLADSYVLLTTLDMLALKNFKITLDTLDALGYPRTRWQVVLNRFDSHVGLSVEDMERTIGLPITTKLPSSKDVPASLNRGVTLVGENPKHPFSRAVLALAELEAEGAPAAAKSATKSAPASRSLLRGFGRKVGV